MAFDDEVVSFFRNRSIFDMTLTQFIIRLILAVILIIAGVYIGRLVRRGILRLLKEAKLGIGVSFFHLMAGVVEFAIYVLFISLAINQLGIPVVNDWITSILIIIPAIVGALILIGIGFAFAVYLRSIVEDSNIVGKNILAMIFFYFVIYISLIYSVKTALIPFDKSMINVILIILTGIIGVGVAFYLAYSARKIKK